MSQAIAYDPLLVLLSIAIAIQASYVGLRLTIQVSEVLGGQRRLLLVGASLSLAMGIWGMHFVGMLAAHLPVGVQYQVLPTLLSFLLCVMVVGFAIVGASLWPKTVTTLAITATVMGVGIATMHYVGMMALHDSMSMNHDPLFLGASIAAAISASASALWLATMAQRRPALILCAVLLGLAISSMHYIAMAGTTMQAMDPAMADMGPSLSSGLMAIVVAVVAFLISAGFFLTLVPASDATPADARLHGAEQDTIPSQPVTVPIVSAPSSIRPEAAAPSKPVDSTPKAIPVERDGTRVMMAPQDIYAVRANAHYCAISNASEEWFCSLSISDVEAHLRGGPFARVHRSHIVNLDRILVVRKTADGGFADLDGFQHLSVPISRAKVSTVVNLVSERLAMSRTQQAG